MATYANSWAGGTRRPCWRDYFLDEVVPTIERRFRVRPGRRWHAIGGFSSGALGAVLYAATAPGYFGQVLSLSGVLSTQRPEDESGAAVLAVMALVHARENRRGRPDAMARRLRRPIGAGVLLGRPQPGRARGRTVALTCVRRSRRSHGADVCRGQASDDDIRGSRGARRHRRGDHQRHVGQGFHDPCPRAAGADVTYRAAIGRTLVRVLGPVPCGTRSSIGVSSRPVPERPTSWTYKTVATSGDMWGIGFAFDQPPTALATFTRTDNRLSGRGAGTVQLELARGLCAARRRCPSMWSCLAHCRIRLRHGCIGLDDGRVPRGSPTQARLARMSFMRRYRRR